MCISLSFLSWCFFHPSQKSIFIKLPYLYFTFFFSERCSLKTFILNTFHTFHSLFFMYPIHKLITYSFIHCSKYCLFQKPNSWTYNYVEVSWHSLETHGAWPLSVSLLLEACLVPLKRATLAEKRLFWWRQRSYKASASEKRAISTTFPPFPLNRVCKQVVGYIYVALFRPTGMGGGGGDGVT